MRRIIGILVLFMASCVGNAADDQSADTGITVQALSTPAWPISAVSASICYHVPGSPFHRPGSGIGNADDIYALDINCSNGSEGGKAVKPLFDGIVRAFGAGGPNSASYVLVEHPAQITVDGISYPKIYTAYLHMANMAISNDQSVTTATTLGTVSSVGAGNAVHLHFVAYVGEWSASSRTNWGRLRSFNPSLLGGDFSSFDYTPYIIQTWVDDNASNAGTSFVANGTVRYLLSTSSYGMFAGMRYTMTKSWPPDDNSFEFKRNILTSGTHRYYAWPFIPANFGTTKNATYKVLAGTSIATSGQGQVGSFPVNQLNLSDDYAQSASYSISSEQYITVKVGDFTGESGTWLGADHMQIWWKADHCVGNCSSAPSSEQHYCYFDHYEHNSCVLCNAACSTCCVTDTSLPSGF